MLFWVASTFFLHKFHRNSSLVRLITAQRVLQWTMDCIIKVVLM